MGQRIGQKELKNLRDKVDRIDLEIVRLLEKRWKTTKEIGKVKRKTGVKYYDPRRESQVVKSVTKKTKLDKKFVKKIFTAIMTYCRN